MCILNAVFFIFHSELHYQILFEQVLLQLIFYVGFVLFLKCHDVFLKKQKLTGFTHHFTLCIVSFFLVGLTSPLCSLLAATVRRSFGSRGRRGLRVLTSCSSEYSVNRNPCETLVWFYLFSTLVYFSPLNTTIQTHTTGQE